MSTNRQRPTGRSLLMVWVVAAVVLGVLLLIAQLTRGPLDDPDQAYQRPGILDLAVLPEPAAPVTADIPQPGRPAIVFFDRSATLPALCHALPDTGLGADADLVIVAPAADIGCGAIPVVEDPDGRPADAYGMRAPAAGGPPVGYAVIDAQSRIRYRTLDPTVTAELSEVRTMLEAL